MFSKKNRELRITDCFQNNFIYSSLNIKLCMVDVDSETHALMGHASHPLTVFIPSSAPGASAIVLKRHLMC